MSARRRRLAAAAAALLTFGLTVTAAATAAPAQAAAADYVKYYQVTSAAETLGVIAGRVLGSAGRAGEIYSANVGRTQPDGGTLRSASAPLHVRWVLVLPWDAVGTGVKYGLLPAARTATAPKPSPARTTSGSSVAPTKVTPRKPASKPAPKKVPQATAACQAAVRNPGSAENWALLRLAPDQAWDRTRGSGQTVAIVDSGADGTLPQLAARTSPGMDVVGGTGRGNADCLGTGTAMAGIVAAQPVAGSPLVGVAPDATVMPIRVATAKPSARPSDVATAIRMAVSKGATVLVVGSYADTTDRTVAAAMADAVGRSVVVVAPALPAGPALDPQVAKLTAGVLRVGGVGVDGRVMATYRQGGVHLVAPGRDIAALGITGVGIVPVTGPQYAAAFVGATAALVRAAYPELSAAQVVRRLESTADRMPDAVPAGRFGYGLVSPRSAVDSVLTDEAPDPAVIVAAKQRGRQLPALLVVIALVVIVTVLLAIRIRKLVLTRDGRPPADRSNPGTGSRHRAVPVDDPGAGPRHPAIPTDDPPDEEPAERRPTGSGASSEWSREASGTGLAYWGKS